MNGKELLYNLNMHCLDRWMELMEKEYHFAPYLDSIDVSTVAIYGFGMLGRHLYTQLKAEDVPIVWIMDRDMTEDPLCGSILSLDAIEKAENADIIISTSLTAKAEIEKFLSENTSMRHCSIDEIIDNIRVFYGKYNR